MSAVESINRGDVDAYERELCWHLLAPGDWLLLNAHEPVKIVESQGLLARITISDHKLVLMARQNIRATGRASGEQRDAWVGSLAIARGDSPTKGAKSHSLRPEEVDQWTWVSMSELCADEALDGHVGFAQTSKSSPYFYVRNESQHDVTVFGYATQERVGAE